MKQALEVDGLTAPPDLKDERVRQRLGPSAIKVFSRIMQIWNVPIEEARQILALPLGIAIDDLDSEVLSEDQMLRISYVIDIYNFGAFGG